MTFVDTSARRTDAELIQAYAVTQDDAAFSEVAIRYQPMVYQACLRMLGNAHDAQDATQAVFLVLMKKAAQLTRAGALAGWLLDVSRKVSLEAIRRRTGTYSQESEAVLWHEAMADATPVDYEQAIRVLDEELAGLSAKLREAVVLRYLQGNSEKAAAEQAGCPQGTLSRRASDGLARLRQRFARRGLALSGVALVGLLESQVRAAVPETLLPSILAAVKQAVATTATATALPGVALGAKTGTTKAVILAEGAMKAMSIVKAKWVAGVIGAAVVLTGLPVLVMTTRAAAPKDRTTAVTSSADAGKAQTAAPTLAPSTGMIVGSTNAFRFGQVLAQMATLWPRMNGPGMNTDNQQLQSMMDEIRELGQQPELINPNYLTWHDAVLGFALELGPGPISPELDTSIALLSSNLCTIVARQQGDDINSFSLEPGVGLVMKASEPIVSAFTNFLGRMPRADRDKVSGLLRFEPMK